MAVSRRIMSTFRSVGRGSSGWRRWRLVLTVLGLGLAGYALLVGLLFAFQRQILYLPDRSRPALAQAGVARLTEVEIATADGLKLLSWYRPPAGEAPVIAYFHGNGGHIGYRARRLREELDPAWGVLMLGYRGYGGNPGRPSEEGLIEDGRAALRFLDRRGIDRRRLVLYGESLGTGIAVALGAETAAGALILESPYTSIVEAARTHYPFVPVDWLILDRFDSLARIANVSAPTLVLIGERDRVIPPVLGRRLAAAMPGPKEIRAFPAAGHEDIYAHGGGAAVRQFLAAQRLTAGLLGAHLGAGS